MSSDIKAFLNYVWKSHRLLILFGMFFIASIQLLLIYFNSTLDIAPMVEIFLSQIPPNMSEMFGDEILSQISAEGTVAFGLEHPLVITLITFLSISMISRNITSSSGNRFMEIILAHPVKRQTLITSLYLFTMFVLALIIFSAFAGALVAIYFFHELDATIFTNMLKADLNAYLLHLFVMSYALFFSVFLKDVSKAVIISAILTLVFYFIDIISEFWDILNFTKYFNFFSYFDTPKIMVGQGEAYRDIAILAIASLILFVLSFRKFLRKDIA